MDSGNSGSISSSGDEEYDSRTPFLNHHSSQLFPSSNNNPQPSFLPSSSTHYQTHPNSSSVFDLSSPYLHHALSHPQSQPNSFLNLDNTATSSSSQPPPSEPDHRCTEPPPLVPSSTNQCLLTPQDNARVLPSPARNSKKRTRASRRAPTTVLTTDTTNFRAMVQEFTGIPAPPFSGSSYSRRLDLLTASRSGSAHLDSTTPFYPLRPSPQKFLNPSLLLSSTSSPLLHNNVVGAIASSSGTSNNNLVNHHQLPLDLAVPYHYQNPNNSNIMLSMQNHYQPFGNTALSFASRSQGNLSVLEDLGVSHVSAQVGVTVPPGHGHVTPDQANDEVVGSCKLNFNSGSAASTTLLDKSVENNNNNSNNDNSARGEGTAVDSWICSSD